MMTSGGLILWVSAGGAKNEEAAPRSAEPERRGAQ
jgi:hypothetical protein